MVNRQERLEARVDSLRSSARWLGIIGGVLTGLGILLAAFLCGFFVFLQVTGRDAFPWGTGVSSAANALAMGWILLSVRNAFEAIVDIIGELSETV